MSKLARRVVVIILSSAGAPAQEDRLEPLPQGSGLAARFVRDARIESHPDVVAATSYIGPMRTRR